MHRVILGTHTSEDEPNYLQIATVRIPTDTAAVDGSKYDEEKGGTSAARRRHETFHAGRSPPCR